MRKAVLMLVGMAWLLPSSLMGQPGQANAADAARSVPGELLVQFRAGATPAEKGRALGRANAQHVEDVLPASRRRDGRGDLVLVRHQPDLPPAAARQAMQSDAAVEFAEPNWIYEHQAVSNDPYYTKGLMWGMYGPSSYLFSNPYGSNAAAAWAAGKTGSATVYVGVIDEGIQLTHPDLAGQVWVNPYEVMDGKDNDGNGYVDDINGWDFDGNNNTIYDGGKKGSLDSHGTHVSGTIGAKGGNGTGVVGVNWSVTLISGKFLGRTGGTTANAVKAVNYFTDLKSRHALNVVATSNSWGGGGYSQALYDAIKHAGDDGILFIAAAGNSGKNNDTTPHYPSSYNLDNIIAVGSLTGAGAMSSFSNYGATSVDIFAPGSSIYSTTAFNTYSSYSGTSMATPHVTGAVALYKSVNPGATAAMIKNAILSSAVQTPSVAGKCVSSVTGFCGRLDAFAALSK
jgi:subtilisin family serine protease